MYGLCLDEAVALVLRRNGTRIVRLGSTKAIDAGCDALDLSDPTQDPTEALATLRKLLIEPLKLGKDVTRVLISPEGPLCYVTLRRATGP